MAFRRIRLTSQRTNRKSADGGCCHHIRNYFSWTANLIDPNPDWIFKKIYQFGPWRDPGGTLEGPWRTFLTKFQVGSLSFGILPQSPKTCSKICLREAKKDKRSFKGPCRLNWRTMGSLRPYEGQLLKCPLVLKFRMHKYCRWSRFSLWGIFDPLTWLRILRPSSGKG